MAGLHHPTALALQHAAPLLPKSNFAARMGEVLQKQLIMLLFPAILAVEGLAHGY